MQAAPASSRSAAFGAWRRAALAIAWIGGVAGQVQQEALWATDVYRLLAVAGLALAVLALRLRRRSCTASELPGRFADRLPCAGASRAGIVAALAAALVSGFAATGWRGGLRLADALGAE